MKKGIFIFLMVLSIFFISSCSFAKYSKITPKIKVIQIHEIDKKFDSIELSALEADDNRDNFYD